MFQFTFCQHIEQSWVFKVTSVGLQWSALQCFFLTRKQINVAFLLMIHNSCLVFSKWYKNKYMTHKSQISSLFFLAVVLLWSIELRAAFSAPHPVGWEYIPGSAVAFSGGLCSGAGSGQWCALQLLNPTTITHHPRRTAAQTFLQNGHQDAWWANLS